MIYWVLPEFHDSEISVLQWYFRFTSNGKGISNTVGSSECEDQFCEGTKF